jgi:type I restriction enzyme, S subunit
VGWLDGPPQDFSHHVLREGDILFSHINSVERLGACAIYEGQPTPLVHGMNLLRLEPDRAVVEPEYLLWCLRSPELKSTIVSMARRAIGQASVNIGDLGVLCIPCPPLSEQRRIASMLRGQMDVAARMRAAAATQLESAKAWMSAGLLSAFDALESWGFPIRRLGEVCDIQLGKMLSPASKTGTRSRPYLRNANVQWDRFDLSEIYEMDFSEREEQKFSLQPGDVLVCEGGEPGRAAVWAGEIDPCCYQKALHRLRPTDNAVDPHFVAYRLWAGAIRGEFAGSHAKTTIAHLPAVRLATLGIALPRVEEQRAIASALRDRAARLETVISGLHGQLEVVDRLPAVLLRRAFSGGI